MLLPYLRLVRVGTLFSPAADVVAGLCLVSAAWSGDLVRAAVASVCVYAAGMVLNDHADRAEDARQRPERPIPSGQIPAYVALLLGAMLLAGGILLAPDRTWYAGLAALVVAYDYLLKKRLWLAALTMGTLRAGNLLAGAVVATGGSLPDDRAALAIALGYGLYIVAVTLLGGFEDDPTVRARAVVGVQSVPPLVVSLGLLTLPERTPAAWIGIALALWFGSRVRRQGEHWDQAAIRRSMTWLLLGTMVFTSLVCLGCGRPWEAVGIAAAILPARMISRRIALT